MGKLKVLIDFRIDDPRQGVGTAVLALAHGLGRLPDLDQEYIFIVKEKNLAWIEPHMHGSCRAVAAPTPRSSTLAKLKARLRHVRILRRLWLRSRPSAALVPRSDGFLETLDGDVVHFPSQMACATSIPSIYQPWDLQHCHYPEFFAPEDLLVRTATYPFFCHQARFVCVQTDWVKQDVVRQYHIDPQKIVVIRWGTAFEAYQPPLNSEIDKTKEELGLPSDFFLYPAVTWPHKNHELLLHTLNELRDKGRIEHIVLTGASTPHRERLDALVREMNLQAQVHFLGFVTSQQLQTVYRLATAMVFPSRFEGLGLPILEAFRVGLPVLCASTTVLPEVVGKAALLFDPDRAVELGTAMEEVRSPEVRTRLLAEASLVLERYSADRAAQEFSKLYQATVEGMADQA